MENIKGKRNGNGKKDYKIDILLFDEEYLNGERNGNGKEYYRNGSMKFEGEYLNNSDEMKKNIII